MVTKRRKKTGRKVTSGGTRRAEKLSEMQLAEVKRLGMVFENVTEAEPKADLGGRSLIEVVTHDVAANTMVAGVPARVIRTIDHDRIHAEHD